MRNQIVILAAGKGTRMGGDIPKVLVNLNHRPLILYILEEMEKINQLIKPVVVVGFEAEKVRTILGNNYFFALQKEQLGTAHALMAAKSKVGAENILVLYGDMPFIKAESLKNLMRLHKEKSANISMFTAKAESFEGDLESLNFYGRIIRDEKGQIVKIVEYKDANLKERELKEVNPGIYMFNAKWLWEKISLVKNQNMQGEYYLTDIVEVAIKSGEYVNSLVIDPYQVLGVNTPKDLEVAEKQLKQNQ